MGRRQYYSLLVPLSEIPHLFKFNDWAGCTPELQAQRILNKARVPDITSYILENDDGFLFSSITASYSCPVKFTSSAENADVGTLEMELENLEFIINDGQHRCAAIAAALKENPALGKEKISVLLFETESMERLQQMFSDLNRFVQQTSKSLGMLYDRRDNLSALTMELAEQVDVFRHMVEKEKVTIPRRSPSFLPSRLYTKRTKNCWVKKSLNRDHRCTERFSRRLSNTGQSFRRSLVTGKKSKMANLALPNSAKRRSIPMRLFCVRWEALAKRYSKNILGTGGENSNFSKGLIGGKP